MWVSSRGFAEKYNIGYHALKMACIRSNKKGKKICTISSYILHFTYIEGIGRGGKILQIWNTPLSQKQVEALEKGYLVEYVLEEMGNESKAVENPQCVGFRNDLNGGVAKSLVCKNMDCPKEMQSNAMESRDFKALHCKGVGGGNSVYANPVYAKVGSGNANASKDCSVYANPAYENNAPTNPNANNPHNPKEMESNVMESRDFKTLCKGGV